MNKSMRKTHSKESSFDINDWIYQLFPFIENNITTNFIWVSQALVPIGIRIE